MLLTQELHLELDQCIVTLLKAKKIEVVGYCKQQQQQQQQQQLKTVLRSIKGFDEQTPGCYF